MAKAKAAPAAAKKAATVAAAPVAKTVAEVVVEPTFAVDQRVEFVGYSGTDIAEDAKILVPGQILVITVAKGGDDGYEAIVEGSDPLVGDTVFPDEIKAAPTTKAGAKAAAASVKANTPPVTKSDAKAAKAVTKAKETPVVPPVTDKPLNKKQQAQKDAADAAAKAAPTAATRVIEGEVVRVQDTAAVAKVLQGQDALTAAKALVEQSEETYFTLGGVLNHIYTEGSHKMIGFEGKRGFADYVEKSLGVAYRKAMYLISIYTYFRSLGVDEKRLAEIGWSKAKEMVGLVTADAFNQVVDFASKHSREELSDYIKTNRVGTGEAGGDETDKKRFNFVLFGDAAAGVERALEAAKSEIEGEPKNLLSMAFELIVTEWAMTKENVEVSLEDAVAALEARFGIESVNAFFGVTEDTTVAQTA